MKYMIHIDINGIDIDSLEKVLSASFPDSNYVIEGKTLIFDSISKRHELLVRQVLSVLFASAKFQSNRPNYPSKYILDNNRIFYREDIHHTLLARGDLVWIGEGLAVLSGDLLRVKRALEKYWFDYAISELKATEIENPALWSSEVAEKSKYLTDFPHEATFILGAKRDNISIGNVEKLVSQENFLLHDINLSDALPSLSLVGFCQPSVCTSCYYAIGKRMSASNEIYTTYNRVFRNEGTKSLERLLSFSVRDIMVVGNDAFVRETRDVFLKKALRFIEELNFEAKIISATDPFFATKSSKIFMQKTGDLKHEIQAWVPFEKKAIAVGSINLHLDTFGRRFSMKNQDDFSFSSCFGIGFERLTYALFSQNGPNLLEWDETLLERLALI